MPVELEWKFILPYGLPPSIPERNIPRALIEQGYLGSGARIRRISREDTPDTRCFFGWKYKMKNGSIMEIEPEISPEDYEALVDECGSSLTKFRYRLPDTGSGVWDVDVFTLQNKPVLCMAEVEHSAISPWKPGMSVHPLLNNVTFQVPDNPSLFSSYALSTPEGMKTALKAVRNSSETGHACGIRHIPVS